MARLKRFSNVQFAVIAGIFAISISCSDSGGDGPSKKLEPGKTPEVRTTAAAAKTSGDPMPEELMAQAALDGKVDIVRKALESGTDANTADEEGRTPLMLASFNGHGEIVQMLLDAGAKVGVRDGQGRTPLMFASTGPFAEVVGLLLRHGAEVNIVDSGEHWTALMFAAGEGQIEVVRLLLDKGADPTLKDVDGDTAAAFAQRNGHAEVFSLLKQAEKAKQ